MREINLSRNIDEIISYSKNNPPLDAAHHILYNLPHPDADLDQIEFVVMGMNPGESKQDLIAAPGTLHEETHRADFHEKFRDGRRAVSWTSKMKEMCGTSNLIQTEAFFWSSNNTSDAFEKRFGEKPKSRKMRPYFEFCADMNIDLINTYKPRAIVFPGLGWANLMADIYNLKATTKYTMPDKPNQKIAVIYEDSRGLDWIFTPHWTGTRGLTKNRREKIGRFIARYLNRPKREIEW